MNEYEKISRLEMALRVERDELRRQGGPENMKGANAINTYLQNADTASKLRFANILLDAAPSDEQVVRLRAGKR